VRSGDHDCIASLALLHLVGVRHRAGVPGQTELVRLGRYPLLVIDEVGYIPFEPEPANLFQLVSSRYERASLTSPAPSSNELGLVIDDHGVGSCRLSGRSGVCADYYAGRTKGPCEASRSRTERSTSTGKKSRMDALSNSA
jgi:hypothetical protein